MEGEKKTGDGWAGWLTEKRAVKLLLLAAALTLGVLYFDQVAKGAAFLWQIAQPLVIGAVMAYVLEIVIKQLEKVFFPHAQKPLLQKLRRPACILLGVMLVLGFFVLIVLMVIPGLTDAFNVLASEVPHYFGEIKNWVLARESQFPALAEQIRDVEFDWQFIQEQATAFAMKGLGGILSSTVTVIGAVTVSVVNFFMSLIFAVFLLSGKKRLNSQFHRLLSASVPAKAEGVRHVLQVTHKAFSGFIVGQSLNGLVMGVFTWLGMLIFKMPYALIVGVVSGTTALIPIIGGYIGAALGAFLVFTVSPAQALWFLVFIIILQNLSGNLIYPRLVGSSIGLPGIWVLVAVTLGGGLDGVTGMLVGVPIAAALYVLLREWVQKRTAALAASNDATAL